MFSGGELLLRRHGDFAAEDIKDAEDDKMPGVEGKPKNCSRVECDLTVIDRCR